MPTMRLLRNLFSKPFTKKNSHLRCITTTSVAKESTVDENEIRKFEKLSADWWSKTGHMKELHTMNKLRVPFIRDGLIQTGVIKKENVETDRPLDGLKLLDVGCGGGILTEPLARLGAQITGLDATKELIDVANDHMKSQPDLRTNLNYINSSIEEYSESKKETFDAVISSEVIEHVILKKDFLQHCVSCLKPGGSIFLTTISQTLASKFLAIYVAENVLKVVPKGTHEHDKFISPHCLQRLLEDCDCTTRRIHGFTLNPLSHEWFWISSTGINYALHAIKNSS